MSSSPGSDQGPPLLPTSDHPEGEVAGQLGHQLLLLPHQLHGTTFSLLLTHLLAHIQGLIAFPSPFPYNKSFPLFQILLPNPGLCPSNGSLSLLQVLVPPASPFPSSQFFSFLQVLVLPPIHCPSSKSLSFLQVLVPRLSPCPSCKCFSFLQVLSLLP